MKTNSNGEPRNTEVVRCFLCRTSCEGYNLISTGDKLISYGTVIGQWIGDQFVINDTIYTPTTTKHQSILRRTHQMPLIRLVLRIPKGTPDLTPYLIAK